MHALIIESHIIHALLMRDRNATDSRPHPIGRSGAEGKTHTQHKAELLGRHKQT